MSRNLVVLIVIALLAAAGSDAISVAAARPVALSAAPSHAGTYVPVTPARILDTQRSLGAPPIGAGQYRNLLVPGRAGVPSSGVVAVVLTLTVSRPAAKGYVTVYPHGTPRPVTSNINFAAGQSQADAVYAPVGADGRITVYNGSAGSVRLLGDVTGYFTAAPSAPAGAFVPTAPTRIYDSRASSAVAAHASRAVSVLGHGPIPASGVSAVVATVTALYPGDRGYLTVYAGGTSQPATSNVDFSVHHTVGNLVVSQVGRDGRIDVYNGSDAAVGLVVDVQGYFLAGSARLGGTYVPTTPERLATQQPLASAGTASLTPNGVPDASPVEGTDVLNLTVTGVTSAGYAIAFGARARPSTSSLSLTAGEVAAGTVTVPAVGSRVYNGSGSSVRYTTDRFGYFLAAAGAGAVSGTVRDATSAAGLAGVNVITYAQGTDDDGPYFYDVARTVTSATGTYSVPTLPAGQDYRVCFDALGVAGPNVSTGFASRCYDGVPWASPGFSLDEPASSEQIVLVTAGGDAIVNQSLARITVGTLTGRVTTAGSPLAEVRVDVTPHGDTDAASTEEVRTDSSGSYVMHLTPGSYDVCFDPRFVTGQSLALVHKCTTAPVTIEVGRSTALDAALASQGVVSGTVKAVSGAVLTHAVVTIFTPSGTYLTSTTVDTTGHYTLPPQDPGNYVVCFSADADAHATYGYASECYNNVPAPAYGNDDLPSGTTPVTITDAGTTTTANASLSPAGAVSGTVTGASNGSKLQDVLVLAFSAGGIAARGFTDAAGHYVLDGLPASSAGYAICVNPGSVPSGSGGPYAGQCYRDVAWNPQSSVPAAGATPVSVASNADHTGIDAALTN